MAKTISTVLTLRDKMSGKLKKIQKTSAGAASDIQKKCNGIGKQWEVTGQKITKVGSALTTGVTVPIIAIGTAAASAWKEVDAGMDTVIQKTGATGAALEGLKKSVENVATSIPTSFEEAGEAVGEINTRFGVTGEELDELSKQFIEFSKLTGSDLTSSIDSAQSAMAAFGVSTEDAGVFLDTLNAASQQTGTDVNTIADSMKTNAASLKEMGYSASDAAFFLANLDKSGVDAAAAMTAMKKGLVTATKDGKTMAQAMSELQNTIKNAPTDTEAYAAAIEMFGSRSGTAIAEAVRSGRISFDQLNTSMSDFSGNVSKTFEATKDPVDDFQTQLNKVKLIGADIGATVMPVIATVLEKLAEILDKAKAKWDSLNQSQKDMIVKIAGIAAVVGPALMIIGKIVTVVGLIIPKVTMVISIIGKVVAAVKSVIAVLKVIIMVITVLTGLPALVVVAIAAAIALALVLIVKFRKQIWEFFNAIYTKIGEFAVKLVQKVIEIKDAIPKFFAEMGEAIKSALAKPFEWISEKIEAFKNGVGNIVDSVKSTAANVKDKVVGHNATGTPYWRGGQTVVGEHGPEVVDLPKGSRVYTNQQSKGMNAAPVINLSLNVQGNIIGNEEYANMLSEKIAGSLIVAMAN